MEDDRDETNLTSAPDQIEEESLPLPKAPKRRFVGRRVAAASAGASSHAAPNTNIEDSGAIQVAQPRRPLRALNAIPDSILNDPDVNAAIALLPSNYNFELHKTIHRIQTSESKRIALQFPEGLLLFATTISDILTRFCPGTETLIIGDVTYGACCVDDYTARALGCDLLIHYAHSCLIPVDVTRIKTLYVFVDIGIDIGHLVTSVTDNFPTGRKIAVVGTIQFNATIHSVKPKLEAAGFEVVVPQISPLSKGEVLGCTAPKLGRSKDYKGREIDVGADMLLYLGDGRFHLESAMIQNPDVPAYRYDPYSRKLTKEEYGHDELYDSRSQAVLTAKKAKRWGLILGSLGRQGNPHTLTMIEKLLEEKGVPWITLLLSEIFPGKLAMMDEVEAWVQVACPRLSIDWGYAFPRPLLSPYEALVALGVRDDSWVQGVEGRRSKRGTYPMDFYAKEGLGRTREGDVALAVNAGG